MCMVEWQDICSCLQRCTKKKDLAAGRRLHSFILASRIDTILILGDHLIRMFAYCGSLLEANLVFCKAAKPSIYTWQAIISAHAIHQKCDKAFELYMKMKHNGIEPNEFIFQCILQICSTLCAIDLGKQTHNEIMISGFDSTATVGISLIDMYGKCRSLEEASKVFHTLQKRNVISWSAMITAHVHHGHSQHALELFMMMQQDGVKADKVGFLSILKACGIRRTLHHGKLIHDLIIRSGFDSDVFVGSSLVNMYGRCNNLDEACKIFHKLTSRDIVSWGALILGYAEYGDGCSALKLFVIMQQEGIKPNEAVLSCILKACSSIGALEEGQVIHDEIMRNGLATDIFIGTNLIDMYAKCGSLENARNVFDKLVNLNVVAYGAMIAGYAQHDQGSNALELFEKMQEEGIKANNFIISGILDACGSMGDVRQGNLIHDQILKSRLESEVVIGSALVDMYAKCGCLEEAYKVFNAFQCRNVMFWGALLAVHAQHGHFSCALELFAEMQLEGVQPNEVIICSILKVCGSIGASALAKLIHEQIIRRGFDVCTLVGNALLDTYCKCGSLKEAYKVFRSLSSQDLVSWGVMIGGYAQNKLSQVALELFAEMLEEGIEPHKVTVLCILKVCGSIETLWQGKHVHDHIICRGLQMDLVIGNALINMYGKCGSLEEACNIFDELPVRDVVSCSAMIAAYAQVGGLGIFSIKVYEKMQQEGIRPNEVTFLCVVKACRSIKAFGHGKMVHDQIMKGGLTLDGTIGNAMIDMYAKCGHLEEAENVFHKLLVQDVVSWTVIIAGYAQNGDAARALYFFGKMHEEGIEADKFVFSWVLKACGNINGLRKGKLIHSQIMRSGIEWDIVVGSNLVDMYARCGSLEDAQKVFDELPDHNCVSWGALLAGYAQHGHDLFALELFKEMQKEAMKPNIFTFLSILKACGSIGSLQQGKLIHELILQSGFDVDVTIESTLVQMYAECGSLQDAHKVFDGQPSQDAISWSVMIACYAHHDDNLLVVKNLEHLQQETLQPLGMICTNVLSTCGHLGQVEEGLQYFTSMIERQGSSPSVEHFNCMIGLMGNAGLLEEAEQLLKTMPILPDSIGWLSLLNACRTHGNVKLARQCFYQIIQLDPKFAAGYVLMTNLYASVHMWDDILQIQKTRISAGVWKRPGRAWVEVNNHLHQFTVGDKTHRQSDEIYANVKRMRRQTEEFCC